LWRIIQKLKPIKRRLTWMEVSENAFLKQGWITKGAGIWRRSYKKGCWKIYRKDS
jgi:hypothetical protein